jgi:hypothetical protein
MGNSITRSLLTPGGLSQTTLQSQIIEISGNSMPLTGAGENLVPFGSFEQPDTAQWQSGPGWLTGVDVTDAVHGESVARLTATSSMAHGALVSDPIPVDPETPNFVIAFYARFPLYTRGYARCLLRCFSADDELLDEPTVVEIANTGEAWIEQVNYIVLLREYEEQIVLPDTTAYVRLMFEAVTGEFVLEIDAVQLCIGQLRGAYTPAVREYIEGAALLPGTVPPEALDTTPPAVPTGLMLTTDATLNADGTAISRVYVSLTHPTDADYSGSEIMVTGEYTQSDLDDPDTRSPVWGFARSYALPKDADRIVHEPAVGGAPYWARARSMDVTGNRSAWTPVLLLPAATDAEAPPIPVVADTIPGFRSVGVWWNAVEASDLSYYQVRWRRRESISIVEGVPNVTINEWSSAATKATVYVATDLETTDNGANPADAGDLAYHGYTYYSFQVRAVDQSGNVRHGRTKRVVVSADAAAAATTLLVADARGLIAGCALALTDDVTTYSIRAVVLGMDGTSGTLTIEPGLTDPRVVGDDGLTTYTSVMPVLAVDDEHAGYSNVAEGYPTLTGQADITANAILANMIAAGQITAGKLAVDSINANELFVDGVIEGDKIKTLTLTSGHIVTEGLLANVIKAGTLYLGGEVHDPEDPEDPADNAVLVLKNTNDDVVGTFDGTGVLLMDPDNRERQMRFRDGVMEFTENGNPDDPEDPDTVWGTAIDARGVTADSILIGRMPGGQNAIPNASFERTPPVALPTTNTWTTGGAGDSTHWGGSGTLLAGSINIDTSGSDLQLTSDTY